MIGRQAGVARSRGVTARLPMGYQLAAVIAYLDVDHDEAASRFHDRGVGSDPLPVRSG
jgi:hypothetical protein